MAIIQENVNINGHNFIHTYSNTGHFIIGGEPYGQYIEAYDPIESNRQYIEGELIDDLPAQSEEIMNILLGGSN